MKVKFILPALIEAKGPFWRPIKYSLFPPLGLATLAAWLDPADEAEIVDEHVEELYTHDEPDLVAIEVYVTNAFRAYSIADGYRKKGVMVILGGLHVTSLPDEAEKHADAIFLGPAEDTFPEFLGDWKRKQVKKRYFSVHRTLENMPPIRRDLIKRQKYLVPNSLVVSRGCPHRCDFCYKDSFFKGGKSFYVQKTDNVLDEITSLPGKHLYFLDDHLFANPVFARSLFEGMKGMGRVFQGAATVNSILQGDLLQKATDAGLRSLFIGFETLSANNLAGSNKRQNLLHDYKKAIRRLHDHGIMINGSFVFGFDGDDQDVFGRTVEWAVEQGITTATFHILTPYPGTRLFDKLLMHDRIEHFYWDLYDTRHVVYKPRLLSASDLKEGYNKSYRDFYSWSNIWKASTRHGKLKHVLKHLAYTGGWKKFEPLWNFVIKSGALAYMLPLLEMLLSRVEYGKKEMEIPEIADWSANNVTKFEKNVELEFNN